MSPLCYSCIHDLNWHSKLKLLVTCVHSLVDAFLLNLNLPFFRILYSLFLLSYLSFSHSRYPSELSRSAALLFSSFLLTFHFYIRHHFHLMPKILNLNFCNCTTSSLPTVFEEYFVVVFREAGNCYLLPQLYALIVNHRMMLFRTCSSIIIFVFKFIEDVHLCVILLFNFICVSVLSYQHYLQFSTADFPPSYFDMISLCKC